MKIDNREKYKDVRWMQGYTRDTVITKRWSPEVLRVNELEERRRIYTSVSGRLGELVMVCESVDECVEIIKEHNRLLNVRVIDWVTNI